MKVLIWILCFSTWAWLPQTQAQTVANGWIIEDIHGPSQVGIVDTIPVDINQDGLMDVVSASIDDGHLRAYINQGNYQFEQQYISKEVPGIYRVSAVDLNQDGQTDFLLPSIATHEIIGLIAETDGYRKHIIADDVVLPTDAQAADLNNDGLVDVASISFENNELHIHQQQANGSFQSQIVSFSANKPRKLQISDFNNDGLSDILLASSGDDTVRLFENQGNFSFNELLITNQMTGTRFLAECNLNDDNLIDFAVSATGDDTVYIFANIGNLQFEPKPIDNNLPGANALHCADIDNDQQTELISIASNTGNIYTHELSGNFERKLIANTRDGYVSVNTAKFMPNDPPKILTQAYFENRNLLYTPNFTNQEAVVWEDFPDGAYYVDSGDIDNDGDKDLVYAAFHEDTIYWAEQQDSNYIIHVIFSEVDGPQSITIGDVDSDGHLDVVSAGAWDDSFWFHKNLGGGVFNTIRITGSANNAARTTIVDVNGDGDYDVVGTSSLDNSLRWFEWDGQQFSEHIIDEGLVGALALSSADVDTDGAPDLVVGSLFGNDVSLLTNNGFGFFSKQVISKDKPKPSTVLTADVDGDLDLDIIFAASGAGSVWILENNFDSFDESLISFRGSNVNSLALVNFGQNDYLDIVNVSNQQGDILISVNLDNLKFETNLMFETRLGMSSIISFANNKIPKFAMASNVSNSLQALTRVDLIYRSSFENNGGSNGNLHGLW